MTEAVVHRIEADLKATGRAIYPGEIRPPRMLHAALVEAQIARGSVVAIDTAAARAMGGVVGIVSHEETQELADFAVTQIIREKRVHFVGQPVALVVAETLSQARAAAQAVEVAYAAETPVTALDQALDEAYAPKLASRVVSASRRGDAETALTSAPLVLRRRYETSVNNHHPMEPHATVCDWNDGRPLVHTTTQAVFATQRMIARAFGLNEKDVRVVTRYLGGGFGCKGQLWWPWEMLALLAARRIGRPVRLELTRAQLFTLVGRRQETVQALDVGFETDGRLVGIVHDVLGQTSTHGEYADPTAAVSRWLYACPNVTTRHRLVRTNEPQPVPMRAPGIGPGSFALESALDEAANALGIDPVDLRIRNFADRDQDSGRPWSSNSLLECYRAGAEQFGWARRPKAGAASDGRWRVGWGMATTCYPAHRQPCATRLRIDANGYLLVQCGTQDMGSGTYTALGQMAAQIIGVPMSSVTVEIGDTLLPEGPFSGGSQVTASFTPAIEEAAHALRHRILSIATGASHSPLLGLAPQDLALSDGRIIARSGNAGESIADLLGREAPDGLEILTSADLPVEQTHTGMGFGAIFAEVGVDPDLGEIRVRRMTGAFAAGRIVNPLLAESQYVGGLIGGIGMALHEQTVTDCATGRILGDDFANYLIPVHADMPQFDIVMVDEKDEYLPGGVKGIGMLGTAGTQAAIANALHHAIGLRARRLPIRIEDVLGAGTT